MKPMAAIFYSPILPRAGRWLLFSVSIATVLPPLCYGIARFWYGYAHFGPAAAYVWSLPWLGVSGLILLAWLALFARMAWRSRFTILVYRNGLAWGNSEPGSPHAPVLRSKLALPTQDTASHACSNPLSSLLSWEEVSGIIVELIASSEGKAPSHRVILFCKSGRKLHLIDARSAWDALANLSGPRRIENLPELVTRIKSRYYPRLLPRLRLAFHAGETLSFGPISIHKEHITMRSASRMPVPWGKVNRVTVQSGTLVVELENSKNNPSITRFPVSKIPNLELMLSLIEEYSC
jgi:hypothetical protein